jgi:diaminobutyrate-2-oxoglutarate transaminase
MSSTALDRQSNVRSYSRAFPAIFDKAKDAFLFDISGRRYIDFLSGAGALNYGHNNDLIKRHIIEYLSADRVVQALDLDTAAKAAFFEAFEAVILQPRGLPYKVQFTGPTGSDAVEAALKLARKVTGRRNVFAFMGSFHGMTLGSLAATGARRFRGFPGAGAQDVTFVPFADGAPGCSDSLGYLDHLIRDELSGVDKPAAVLLETVQAEGGVNVASSDWLKRLRSICDTHGVLLVCDDIQMGCGRTGAYFSFERAGVVPDLVTLSKSFSGYGLPLSAVLIRPDLDIWKAGEHTGTFRSHPLALVGATAALEHWKTAAFADGIAERSRQVSAYLLARVRAVDERIAIRGLGLLWGVDVSALGVGDLASRVSRYCFEAGLIIECVGRNNQVLKLMPPLTISSEVLEEGCGILEAALRRGRGEISP